MMQAIEIFRMPTKRRQVSKTLVPSGMLDVIKAAAGDEATLLRHAEAFRLSEADIKDACKHYLLTMLLDPTAQGERLLGLEPGAPKTALKDHKRWLLKWLHPDRNPSPWENTLFHKISEVSLENIKELPKQVAPPEPDVVKPPVSKAAVVGPSQHDLRRRNWVPVTKRKRTSTKFQMVSRFFRPLVAAGLLALALIIGFSVKSEFLVETLTLTGTK
jgi:hypothetical protein